MKLKPREMRERQVIYLLDLIDEARTARMQDPDKSYLVEDLDPGCLMFWCRNAIEECGQTGCADSPGCGGVPECFKMII